MIRHRQVAVAVIFDEPTQSFLLCHNKRWNGYAFPMKHIAPDSGISPADVALDALDDREVPLNLPNASATPLDYYVETLQSEAAWSEAAWKVTVYEYHSFEIHSGMDLPDPLHPDLRLFTYQQLQDAINVTSSTKAIARSFVEDRKVAVAVIARHMPAGCEFLLVHNAHYGYFFPSTRIKTNAHPPEAAIEAARMDLGYDGPWEVVDQSPEVPGVQESQRFGLGERRFHYHLCLLNPPDVDLLAPENELANSLNQLGRNRETPAVAYWRWATEDQLRNDPTMSKSMPAVLQTVLQLVE